MKKFFALLTLSAFFTGCSLFGGTKEGVITGDPIAASGTDFETVMAQMHDYYSQYFLEMIPSSNLPEKYSQKFDMSGQINPMVEAVDVETINFSLISEGIADISDENNMQGESTLTLSGDFSGGETNGQGSFKLDIKSIGTRILLNLSQAEVSMNGEALPVGFLLGQYMNTWYELSLEEYISWIGKMTGESEPLDIDPQELLQTPQQMIDQLKSDMQIALDKMHFWNLSEELGEKDGMLQYKVSLDREKLRTSILAIVDFASSTQYGMNQVEIEQAKQEIEAEFEETDFELSGVLSVSKDDIRRFMFEGTATNDEGEEADVTLKWLDSEIHFLIAHPEEGIMEFKKTGDSYEITENGEKLMEGTWTTDLKNGTMWEEGQEFANFAIMKKGEREYSAQMNILEENIQIVSDTISWTDEPCCTFDMTLAVNEGENSLATMTIDYDIEKADSVSIEVPAETTSLIETIEQLMQGLIGGATAPTGLTPPTGDIPEYDEAELEALLEQYEN